METVAGPSVTAACFWKSWGCWTRMMAIIVPTMRMKMAMNL